jgi:hypothetical protein
MGGLATHSESISTTLLDMTILLHLVCSCLFGHGIIPLSYLYAVYPALHNWKTLANLLQIQIFYELAENQVGYIYAYICMTLDDL